MSKSKAPSLEGGDCLCPFREPQPLQTLPFPQNPPTRQPAQTQPALSKADGIEVDSKQFPENTDCNKQDDCIGDLDDSWARRTFGLKAQPAPGKIVQKPHQQKCGRNHQV